MIHKHNAKLVTYVGAYNVWDIHLKCPLKEVHRLLQEGHSHRLLN